MSWSRVWGTLAVASLLAGCRQIVGIDDREASSVDASSDTDAVADTAAPTACESCLQTNCARELNDCDADPACRAYSACETACVGSLADRDDCRQKCAWSHSPATSSANVAREVCEASRCADACNAACGAHVVPTLFAASASSCAKCIRENCCAGNAACGANADCTAIHHCWDETFTPESGLVCNAGHPEGFAVYIAQVDPCLSDPCQTACGIGSEYSCLGSRTLRWAKGPEITVSLQVVNGDSGGNVSQMVHVRVCRPADPACSTPLHDLWTNDQGKVSYTLAPANANAFLMLDEPSGTFRKTLWIRNAPLDTTQVTLSAGMMPEISLSSLLGLAGVSELTDRGIVYLQANDCAGNRARESTRKEETGALDGASIAYRHLDSSLVLGDGPSNTGVGGWLNVKQGAINVSTWAPNGKKIGSATAPVRAGYVTEFVIYAGSL